MNAEVWSTVSAAASHLHMNNSYLYMNTLYFPIHNTYPQMNNVYPHMNPTYRANVGLFCKRALQKRLHYEQCLPSHESYVQGKRALVVGMNAEVRSTVSAAAQSLGLLVSAVSSLADV